MSKYFFFFGFLAAFAVAWGVGRAWKLKPETPYSHNLYRGETAVLTNAAGDSVWLAVRKEDCSSMNVAMAKHDDSHLRGCEDAQTAFAAPAGTAVKVIGASVNRKQVTVLDGPLAGRTGWVEFQYLRPRRAGELR